MIDSIADGIVVEVFKMPVEKDKFCDIIKKRYVIRACKVIGKNDEQLSGDEINDKVCQLFGNDDNDDDTNEHIYFHDIYQNLCLKCNVKPLEPFVGTDR